MVQLSSPKPDMIPVQNGNKKIRTRDKTDQSNPSEFRRTLEQQKSAGKKEAARASGETDGATRSGKTDPLKKSETKTALVKAFSESKQGKTDELNSLNTRDILKKTVSKKSTASSEKNKSEALPLVNPNAGELTALHREGAEKSGKGDIPPELALTESTGDGVKTEKVDQAFLRDALLNISSQESRKELASLSSEKGDSPGGKKNSLTEKKAAGSRENRGIITLEDRRTVKTEDARAVFAMAKDQAKDALTLEMTARDEIDGTVLTVGDQNSSGRFVLNAAEEQKGSFLLNRQLEQGGTRELAKSIRFIMKDNNQGEIKLILKPEALGKVRIQLNLQENNIVGKIFVENNSVKQVFLNNLPELAKALEDSGFQTTSLEVSVGGGETGRQNQHHNESPVFFHREAADLEEQIPVIFESGTSLSQIDLVI